MKKRTIVKLTSFGLAVMVAVLACIITTNGELVRLRRSITNNYSANLYEFDGSVSNISSALKKAVYSNGVAHFSMLATQLAAESNTAMQCLSKLPSSGETFEKVGKFLTQVGDYSLYLSNKLAHGDDLSDEERQNLNKLAVTADKISHTIEAIRMEYDADNKWNDELFERLDNAAETSLHIGLGNIEEMLADYPTLVYDGPFSDDLINGEIVMLKDKPSVTIEEAKQIAVEILGVDADALTDVSEIGGKMPSYCFFDGDATVQITKQGGYVSFMKKFRAIGEYTVPYEVAVEIAEKYIKDASGQTFVSTYYFAEEGVCTVNLAYKDGATICYPDLIKVGIALDTGEIVSVEASSYLSNHHIRTINTPKYTAAEAKSAVSKMLGIVSSQRAIIPTKSGGEKHCYEFLCKGLNGEDVLVYINVSTLEEEELMILLKTDGGTLSQ